MQTMQQRVLAEIETRIHDAGFDPVQKPVYANTGQVRAMLGLKTWLTIGYGFQDAYCSFTLSGEVVKAAGLTDSPPTYRVVGEDVKFPLVPYDDADMLEQAMALIKELLVWEGPDDGIVDVGFRCAVEVTVDTVSGEVLKVSVASATCEEPPSRAREIAESVDWPEWSFGS